MNSILTTLKLHLAHALLAASDLLGIDPLMVITLVIALSLIIPVVAMFAVVKIHDKDLLKEILEI